MGWFARGLSSSVGTKYVAAISGLFLLLFVLAHMLGNLQIFLGPEALNAYAHKLQSLGAALWVARAGLLGILALHLWAVLRLQLKNWAARPVKYADQSPLKSTLASRTMIWTGLLVLAFIVYHVLHFTLGVTDPATYAQVDPATGYKDVYGMVVRGFQQAPVAISYIVAMFLLWFHLKHGITSIFQTLGLNAPKYENLTLRLGQGLATLILVGNVSMPLMVLLGVVGLPQGGAQ